MEEPGFFPIRKLAIVGLGLIGGSLAIDLRRLGLASKILGYDSNPQHCRKALDLQLVDSCSTMPDDLLLEADWLVLAVPVQSIEHVLDQFRPFLKPDVLITDTGSVKAPLLKIMLRPENSGFAFVGGHPIAGGERFGPEAAVSSLFEGKRFVLTPDQQTLRETLEAVRRLWTKIGSEVIEMDGDLHDRIFASVSHLPHLLAYATIQAIADSDSPEALEHSGAGLKGFSRIASSSPEMWADIFLQNQQPLLQRVDAFSSCISEIREAIVTNDRERLIELLAQAKAAKDRWVH